MKSVKKVKRAVSVLLFLVFTFLSACSVPTGEQPTTQVKEVQPTERTVPAGVLTVPYTSLDSLNPFTTKSLLNSALTSLVFRSLYVTDAGFTAVPDLAKTQSVQGKTVTVTLSDGIYFSDGTELTSDDVAYSFELAKKSFAYTESLKNTESCSVTDRRTVSFTLVRADVNVLNILTFPVAKRGTADSNDSLPVGAGMYSFQKGELRTNLICNLRYGGEIPEIGTVRLYDVTASESLMHLLDIGSIDCFYTDLSEGSAKRTYSSVNEVYLNDLVFIGVNSAEFPLNTADMRKALSLLCDRQQIVENAFMSHARITELPLNTAWTEIVNSKEQIYSAAGSGDTAANALMKTLGYGKDGNKLSLRLIYTDTNSFTRNTVQLLVEKFKAANIELTASKLEKKEYEAALAAGEYDLYLGEVKLTKNMDLSCFFEENGAVSFGISPEAAVRTKYFDYASGSESLDSFIRAFNESVPFIPLCFRNGQFCYSRRIGGTVEVTEDNIFGSINRWEI